MRYREKCRERRTNPKRKRKRSEKPSRYSMTAGTFGELQNSRGGGASAALAEAEARVGSGTTSGAFGGLSCRGVSSAIQWCFRIRRFVYRENGLELTYGEREQLKITRTRTRRDRRKKAECKEK